MSDSDDMPELVDSSDGEEVPKMATNFDYVDAWLIGRKSHLGEHHMCIRKCAYGPLLFGFSTNVPRMWISAMHDSKLLVKKNRETEVAALTKEEWELTDMFTEIFSHVNPKLKVRDHLKSALDAVDEIEKQAFISNGVIDVKKAIEKAHEFRAFKILWTSMSGKTRMKKNPKAAKFCLLYVLKNFQYHVIGYGRDGKLVECDIKSSWATVKSNEEAESSKEKGNKAFKENKFDLAVRWYTQAIKKDPLNHIFYGNRSQAFLKLKKFREALCDGLRAVTLDHDWAKGYYRYAEAYFELGLLDKAREINHMGLQACQRTQDTLNLRQIQEQRAKFKTEKARLEQIEKNIWNTRGPPDLVSDSNDSEDEEDGAPQLISDSDDNCPPVKSTLLRRKQELRKVLAPFNQTLREGSDAVNKGYSEIAMTAFKKALYDCSSNKLLQKTVIEADVVVLKYAYGISSVMTGSSSNIMDGISKFKEITSFHPNVKFPAIYYGLGKAYITLNRYEEAHKPVSSGLAVVKNGLKCAVHCWPGTDKPIPETKKDKLESLLRELMEVCKNPPTPDAVCRHEGCREEERKSIYFSDPDFKGFVRVNCQSMCSVEFHPTCWKAFKISRTEKASDKEQIDKACPTPDCSSCIQRICVYRNEGAEPKVHLSEKSFPKTNKTQKKSQKLEPSSQDKISRKAEKKALRKQRRQEAREAKEEEEKEKEMKNGEEEKQESDRARSNTLASQGTVLQDEQEVESLAKAETMLYKKEGTEEAPVHKAKTKSSKQKKKKEKIKQVLNVEVNFTDRREDQLLGEHSILDEDDIRLAVAVNPEIPFSVPKSLQQQMQDFDSVYDNSINPQDNQHNEVANNLYVYFAELLGEHGPLHVKDAILTKELEDFPPEAREVIDMYGSLKGFLQQSLKFGLIDDFVCLLKDAVKAKKLADAYRIEYPHLTPVPFSAAGQGSRGMQKYVNKNVTPNVIKMCPNATQQPPHVTPNIAKGPSIVTQSLNNHASFVSPVVDKSPLNPSAVEFKPQPFTGYGNCVEDSFVKPACENAVEIDQLLRSAAKNTKFKMTGYNDLDDFSIPSLGNIPESQDEKTLLENMDDIDDIQLCDDELVTYVESAKKFDWSQEQWGDSVDTLPKTNDFPRNGYSVFGPRSITVKPDDLDPSRCSSRSSHSELGEIDMGYQTRSPALQGLKSAYSKKEIQKDVFSPSSYSNSDIFQGSPVLSDVSQRKSPIIPPHPLMSASVSPYNSRPSSCGSPLATVVSCSGDGPSISNIWAPDSTSNFQSTALFTKPAADSNSFFQDPLSNPSQNAFSSIPSTTSWSSTDGLEKAETTSSSYSLFGGLPGSGFGQTSEWNNVKTTVSTSVQVAVETVTTGTSTDFDLTNLLAHYKAIQEHHAQMIRTLHKAEEDKLALTTTVKQFQLDSMKREQQQKALLAQISQHQIQVNTLQQLNTSLEERLQQKDHQLHELQAKQLLSSEETALEITEAQRTLTLLQTQYKNQVNRAVSAEQDYLKLKLQATLQPYTGAKREATFHQHHVSTFVRKCQEDKKELPGKTKQILSHLASVLETCNTRIAMIQTQYERNAQQLSEGVPLCDLPPLSVVSPPVPMPNEIATLMSQIFGSGSSRVPLRLSPTESAPKMLQALAVTPSKPHCPPKPLQPLGLMPLAKTPMTTAQIEAGLQNGQSKGVMSAPAKSSFEKLITAVKNIFPSYDRAEVVKLVHQLRESRGGSLSGISLEDILKNITDMVLQKDSPGLMDLSLTQTYNPAPPPGLASSWGFSAPYQTVSETRYGGAGTPKQTREAFVENMNPCAICHEELELQESQGLDCGHRFHTECIRTWFKEQSTCPNCRVHALLSDDFPSLK